MQRKVAQAVELQSYLEGDIVTALGETVPAGLFIVLTGKLTAHKKSARALPAADANEGERERVSFLLSVRYP